MGRLYNNTAVVGGWVGIDERPVVLRRDCVRPRERTEINEVSELDWLNEWRSLYFMLLSELIPPYVQSLLDINGWRQNRTWPRPPRCLVVVNGPVGCQRAKPAIASGRSFTRTAHLLLLLLLPYSNRKEAQFSVAVAVICVYRTNLVLIPNRQTDRPTKAKQMKLNRIQLNSLPMIIQADHKKCDGDAVASCNCTLSSSAIVKVKSRELVLQLRHTQLIKLN